LSLAQKLQSALTLISSNFPSGDVSAALATLAILGAQRQSGEISDALSSEAIQQAKAAASESLLPADRAFLPVLAALYVLIDALSAGGDEPVNDGTLSMGTSGIGISGSASFSANQAGSSTFTISSNATSANSASTVVARDAFGNFSAGTISASLSGNASTASALQVGRTFSLTGDVTGESPAFDGTSNASISAALANSGVTAGTYRSLTVDSKGRAIAGTNPTTAADYGLTDVPTLGGDNSFTGANSFTNPVGQAFRSAATQDGIVLSGRAREAIHWLALRISVRAILGWNNPTLRLKSTAHACAIEFGFGTF